MSQEELRSFKRLMDGGTFLLIIQKAYETVQQLRKEIVSNAIGVFFAVNKVLS